MSQLLDSVREAPAAARGARPTTTWREDLTAMIIAIWPITALFFDGRNHNNKTGQEITRFDLSEDASTETAMILGEVYRMGAEWKFRAIGQGYKGGLGPLARNYGVNA